MGTLFRSAETALVNERVFEQMLKESSQCKFSYLIHVLWIQIVNTAAPVVIVYICQCRFVVLSSLKAEVGWEFYSFPCKQQANEPKSLKKRKEHLKDFTRRFQINLNFFSMTIIIARRPSNIKEIDSKLLSLAVTAVELPDTTHAESVTWLEVNI